MLFAKRGLKHPPPFPLLPPAPQLKKVYRHRFCVCLDLLPGLKSGSCRSSWHKPDKFHHRLPPPVDPYLPVVTPEQSLLSYGPDTPANSRFASACQLVIHRSSASYPNRLHPNQLLQSQIQHAIHILVFHWYQKVQWVFHCYPLAACLF